MATDKPDLSLEGKGNQNDPNDPKHNPKQNVEAAVGGANVVLSEGNPTAFEMDTTKRESKTGRYIKYSGPALVRIMDAESWNAANVKSERYFEWNFLNHKKIPIEAFSDEELYYLLRVDGRFEIVEDKEK